MDDVDGIVTAQKIREYSSEIYIVFVTAYINYSAATYLFILSLNTFSSSHIAIFNIFSPLLSFVFQLLFQQRNESAILNYGIADFFVKKYGLFENLLK